MSKKKAPALHERRGREDISTRPPRLAGYPIKLAGDARLHRLSLAADSCVNRKYYVGDPGVGQRVRGFVHKPCIRSGPRGRVEIFARSSPGSHEGHIKWPSARAELVSSKAPNRFHGGYGGVRCLVGPLGCGLEVAAKRCLADILYGRGSLLIRASFYVEGTLGYG